MDIREAILAEHSKNQAVKIANYIGSDKDRFHELMDIYFEGPYRVTQRSAYAILHISDIHPELFLPYLPKMVEMMQDDSHHDAVRRNTLRILQFQEIPEDLMGTVADCCFKYLASETQSIAVRAFAMTVLYNICQKWPELCGELVMIIEDVLPYGSAGIKARGKKILKELKESPDL